HKYLVEECEACVVPDVIKDATAMAMPGERITYTLEIPQLPMDYFYVIDPLPDGAAFVPGSLTVTPDIGMYGYSESTNTVYWNFEPAPLQVNQWKPAAVNGPSGEAKLSLSGTSAGTGFVQSPNESMI